MFLPFKIKGRPQGRTEAYENCQTGDRILEIGECRPEGNPYKGRKSDQTLHRSGHKPLNLVTFSCIKAPVVEETEVVEPDTVKKEIVEISNRLEHGATVNEVEYFVQILP